MIIVAYICYWKTISMHCSLQAGHLQAKAMTAQQKGQCQQLRYRTLIRLHIVTSFCDRKSLPAENPLHPISAVTKSGLWQAREIHICHSSWLLIQLQHRHHSGWLLSHYPLHQWYLFGVTSTQLAREQRCTHQELLHSLSLFHFQAREKRFADQHLLRFQSF